MEKDSTSTAPSANVEDSNEVWWIDADPGTDDALAIAIMLAHKNVIGMTISLGNGTIKQCLINAAKVLGVLKKKVPLYKGSSKAITQAVFHGTDGFFGSDSMGDSKMFKDFEGYRDCWRDENGHVAMLKASKEAQKNGKKFKLLCLAPLTTVAVALSIDAKFVDRVDSIVVMGGAIEGQGFTKMSTEFNFDRDPEAAYKVLRDFKNVYVLPIETEKGGVMTIEELKSLRFQGTVFSDFFREIVRFIAINKDDEKGK